MFKNLQWIVPKGALALGYFLLFIIIPSVPSSFSIHNYGVWPIILKGTLCLVTYIMWDDDDDDPRYRMARRAGRVAV